VGQPQQYDVPGRDAARRSAERRSTAPSTRLAASGEFLTTVANRGKAIIEARGASSAASAASAAVDHMHDWEFGTNGRITSMAIPSKGWYGVPKDLIFSFPVTVANGEYTVVEGWNVDEFCQKKIDENVADLDVERKAVAAMLG
jgi:malate dehydrogenase